MYEIANHVIVIYHFETFDVVENAEIRLSI